MSVGIDALMAVPLEKTHIIQQARVAELADALDLGS